MVKHAKEKGYTEPDPRDDLSGLDFARKVAIAKPECRVIKIDLLTKHKVVILGRLAGYGTSLSDIKVENLCPEPLRNRNIPVPKFMEMLSGYDEAFGASLHSAHNDKCSIRYTFILGRDGVASVGIHA